MTSQWQTRYKWKGLGRAHKIFRLSMCMPFALYLLSPLFQNTDKMLEVKRPLCDYERLNLRTEAHGTDD